MSQTFFPVEMSGTNKSSRIEGANKSEKEKDLSSQRDLRESNPYVISGEQDTFRLNFKVMSEDNNLDYDKTDTLRTIQLSQRSQANSENNHVVIQDLDHNSA